MVFGLHGVGNSRVSKGEFLYIGKTFGTVLCFILKSTTESTTTASAAIAASTAAASSKSSIHKTTHINPPSKIILPVEFLLQHSGKIRRY